MTSLLALDVPDDMPITKAMLARMADVLTNPPTTQIELIRDLVSVTAKAVQEIESEMRGRPVSRPPKG